MRLSRVARVRLLRNPLPIFLLMLRKKPTVLQSNSNEAVNETNIMGSWGCCFLRFFLFLQPFDQAFVAVNAIKS